MVARCVADNNRKPSVVQSHAQFRASALPMDTALEPLLMPTQAQADLFPLIRGGGLFLVIVGAAILLGAFQFRWRYPLLGTGAALAMVATIATAAHLAAPHGVPTKAQVGALVVAALLEAVALVLAIRRFSPQGEREDREARRPGHLLSRCLPFP